MIHLSGICTFLIMAFTDLFITNHITIFENGGNSTDIPAKFDAYKFE